MPDVLEVERKYALPVSAGLPAWSGVPGVARVDVAPTLTLEATYYDTAGLRLAAHGVTLRRRTGGDDDGWHLKLPAPGDARKEIRRPLGRGTRAPDELRGLVRGFTGGRPLRAVLHLRTERGRVLLLDADGTVLAEVADDRVLARPLPPRGQAAASPDGSTSWRELEVELVRGAPPLLDEVEDALAASGVERSSSRNKLSVALGERVRPAPALVPVGDLSPTSPAGDVALAYLREQVADLGRWDPEVRRDTDDAVHKMRVAARRLRSALATFRPLLDRAVTDPLRDELRWLGTELGHARDAEVMRDRLLAATEAQPPELVIGPVAARVRSELDASYAEALRAGVEHMDGDRYAALRAALDDLAAAPPWLDAAAQPAEDVLPGLLRKTRTRVRRTADVVDAAETDEARDHALHEVRKAAKRARYAGESLAAVFPRAGEFAAAMEGLQEVLGDHQDGVVTRAALRAMGLRAHLAGENAFTYGLLAGLEEARADRAVEAYAAALRAALHKRLTAIT